MDSESFRRNIARNFNYRDKPNNAKVSVIGLNHYGQRICSVCGVSRKTKGGSILDRGCRFVCAYCLPKKAA